MDLSGAIEELQASLDVVPAALAAVVLLAGPTVAWIVYRLIVQPRTSRYAEEGGGLLWMCIQCRSANEVRDNRCYRCGLERTAISGDLHIVDGDEIVALSPDALPLPTPHHADPIPVMAPEVRSAPEAEPLFLSAARPVGGRPSTDPGAPGARSGTATPPGTPAVTPRKIVVAGSVSTTSDGDQAMVAVGPGKTAATAGKATSPKA